MECPEGYSGTFEDAYSHDKYLRVFIYKNLEKSNFTYQECEDVDECATDNGGCDPRMECVNTIVSKYNLIFNLTSSFICICLIKFNFLTKDDI